MKRLHIILAFFAAIVLALTFCTSCKQSRLKRVRVAPGPVNVSVRAVSQVAETSQRSYVGIVETSAEAAVFSVHGGTLELLSAREGQTVKTGQLLARVKSMSLESSFRAADAALSQARDGYKRAEQVYADGGIPDVKMVELRTKLSQAEATVIAAASTLEDCNVRAPFGGRIADVYVHKGESVIPGQRLLSIIDADALDVVISVPEKEIAKIVIGSGAEVQFPAFGEEKYQARVKSKGLTASSLSHTYKCTLSLIDSPSALMSGMVSKVYMNSDVIKGISVPADMVKVGEGGRYVWVVEDGTVAKRNVEVGGFCGKGVVVTSGLNVGDFIIVAGADKVSAGMKVNSEIVE